MPGTFSIGWRPALAFCSRRIILTIVGAHMRMSIHQWLQLCKETVATERISGLSSESPARPIEEVPFTFGTGKVPDQLPES